MAEIGQVTEIKGNKAVISLERNEACAKCGACMSSMSSKEMILEAKNDCNAKVGENVYVYLKETSFLKAVLIMYTIPLIALLLGIFVTYYITYNELFSVAIGFSLVAIFYIVLRKNDDALKRRDYTPVATSLATHSNKNVVNE